MFSFLGGSSTLLAARQDPTKERVAPLYPTPISFPSIDFLPEAPPAWNPRSAPDLFQHYSRIRKLSDVSAQHLSVLNISLRNNIESNIESLFPTNEIAAAFLPPSERLETSTVPSSAPVSQPRVLSNGRPYPPQHEYVVRSNELRCANEDAYRALTRTPHNGQPPVRLAHFRRFWNALGNIANYWDTSCDEYFPEKSDYEVTNENAAQEDIPEEDEKATAEADEPRKRAKPNPEQDSRNKDFDLPLGSPPPSGGPPLGFRPPQVPGEPARPPGTYRGYRVSNGAGMPDSYRIETARAFVEPIAWAFGFTLAGHRRPPLLEIKSLLVPIKLSGTVWRAPNVRDKARAGYLQGPVLGISCRSETGFAEGKADPVLDTLRELGAMLCLAQERAREGNTERKPGEGKWWTSVPRWGGGPGGEMGEAVSVAREDDIEPGSEVMPPMDPETRGRPTGRSNGLKRKQAIANAWKTLRVGVGFWDPRTEYTAVGKPVDSDWDEVFLISSLNHHVSIAKLRVHKHYLRYLRTGECPEDTTVPDWSTPIISRSKWYDLFEAEARLEIFRLLWGIMGYLARSD